MAIESEKLTRQELEALALDACAPCFYYDLLDNIESEKDSTLFLSFLKIRSFR